MAVGAAGAMIRRVCSLAAAMLTAAEVAQAAAPARVRPRLAVASFSAENVSAGDAAVAADMLRADLVRTGVPRVVEKAHMDKVLAEQRFQLSGCTSNECAVKLGRLLEAELVGTGSFGKLLGTYVLSLRLVRTASQEVAYADSATGRDLRQLEPAIRAMAGRTGMFLGSTAWTDAVEAAGGQGADALIRRRSTDPQPLKLAGPGLESLGAGVSDVVALALLPGERAAAVADATLGAKLTYDWEPTRHLHGELTKLVPGGRVTALALAADGRTVATGGLDGVVTVWRIEGENELPDVFNRRSDSDPRAVYRARTAARVRTLPGHGGAVQALALAPDGRRLASASQDRTARIWDLAGGGATRTLGGHGDTVTSVAWSPDGRRLLTGCRDAVVRLWEADTGRPLQEYLGHALPVGAALFAPDGESMYTACHDGTVRQWRLKDGVLLRTFPGHTDAVVSLALAPDGRALLSGAWDRTARLWDLRTGEHVRTYPGHLSGVRWESPATVGFSPDGSLIGVAAGDKVALWRMEALPREGGVGR